MKRKRQSRGEPELASKRPKVKESSTATPLLHQYYPRVVSLRQYLLSTLATSSAKRRRRISSYGEGQYDDSAIAKLLDESVVGTFNRTINADLAHIDEDISVFTQQLSTSTATVSLTQGAFKQSEIVDFAIWLIFRRQCSNRRPSHVLCNGYQRTTVANGVELELVPRIPGVLSSALNLHVRALKEHPWTALPSLLGTGAERVISSLLIECGVFLPLGESSNLEQLSGVPLCELKTLQANADPLIDKELRAPDNPRGWSDIRLVRHRMLYARPPLTTKGHVRFGLGNAHVLNRSRVVDDDAETIRVLQYIFPRQFGLHNVFTSDVDARDTAQPFRDYTLREKELAQLKVRYGQKRPADRDEPLAERPSHLPKRLRGSLFHLIQRVRKRHSQCGYHALLQRYCPGQPVVAEGSVSHASPPSQVSAFCRAVIQSVFPKRLLGSGNVGSTNFDAVLQAVDRFIRLRRFETLSMADLMSNIKVSGIDWLTPPKVADAAKLSKTDFVKRQELMAELVYYLFDSFLVPLIRGIFHVTESNVHRNQLFYFRHDIWKAMSEPALSSMKVSMFEECSTANVRKMLARRALGVSQVRLLPKAQGMRPIINLRRRVQKLQRGELVLGRSINSLLTPAFSVLRYEKTAHPQRLGSALFSVDDIFPRLQAFRERLRQQGLRQAPLYFAKVDVQACFDTIPQQRLMDLVEEVLSAHKYHITKYSCAKLIGGQNEENPNFGARASWKFLTKAMPDRECADLANEIRRDAAEGRTRTVFVDGAIQKSEQRGAILDLLKEHVQANLIKIGRRFYRQKEGIPQGSIVSSLLCSYIYGELEREVLGFLDDGQTLLLRLIDDFLVISTDRKVAERFMHVMHRGVPQFGIRVKAEKSRANFEVRVDGSALTSLPEEADFPYCGNAINTMTLDLSKDHERRRTTVLADSSTVEYSKLPGQTFYRKTLNAVKLQMHAMLFSTAYNKFETVLSNLYHCFSEIALKSFHYIRSLPSTKQTGDKLVIRTVDDSIQLACILMKRRKTRNKDVLPYECSVRHTQARWLACTAFLTVFQRRQTRHRDLVVWLRSELDKPALMKEAKLLVPTAKTYDASGS